MKIILVSLVLFNEFQPQRYTQDILIANLYNEMVPHIFHSKFSLNVLLHAKSQNRKLSYMYMWRNLCERNDVAYITASIQ